MFTTFRLLRSRVAALFSRNMETQTGPEDKICKTSRDQIAQKISNERATTEKALAEIFSEFS